MTIGELLEVTTGLVELDITIRDNGRYIYRYKIAPKVQVAQSYPRAREILTDGEVFKTKTRDSVYPLPITYIAKDPHDAPKEVKALEIKEMRFTRAIYWFNHYEYNGKPSGGYESQADIICYPKDWAKPLEQETTADLKDQISIFDFEGVNE